MPHYTNSVGKIKRLSEETINKIAAGEVIENPASVVKECIENSLDAGASQIEIEVVGGGFQRIRIVDNGSGMSETDARLCFERHATSKITSSDDLFSLTTRGFRGEALSSIASVAKVTLLTSMGDIGTKVVVEGGTLVSQEPCGRQRGATLEIESLFYNVPARKKFQKSSAASASDIHKIVVSLALAHPGVAFSLVSQGKKLIDVAEGSLEKRIRDLLGDEFLEGAVPIKTESVVGFLGSPKQARSQRSGQYILINDRPVSSLPISFAVRDGYGVLVDEGMHPIFVLHLSIPPNEIDVNVHPQKREVRLQRESDVKDEIRTGVWGAFQKEEKPVQIAFSVENFSHALSFRETGFSKSEEILPWEMSCHPIGLWDHFLILDGNPDFGDGIVIVNLAELYEASLIENFKTGGIEPQGLLIPIQVDLPSHEMQKLSLLEELVQKSGFVTRPIGKHAVVLEGVPSMIEVDEAPELFRTLILEESFEGVAKEVRRKKSRFMLQEGIALWEKNRHKPLGKSCAKFLKRDVIEAFF